MNKTKYIDKLYKKQMTRSGIFKKISMLSPDEKFSIVLNKVLDNDLVDDYVAPLIEYYDEGFLIKPVTKFSFKQFVNVVDVLVINASMQIIELYESSAHLTLDFNFNYYSLIILPKGVIRHTNLKVNDKIKFKSIKQYV